MTRTKVKLAYITNDSARKATFKKRKKGLMKKVSELRTLCGIDACAIVYNPYESQPDVWPNGSGVERVLTRFKRMPYMEQTKKMMNQEGFIRQRIMKMSEQLKKQHRENREKEITEVMYQCLSGSNLHHLGLTDLHDLGWMIDQNLNEICKRIKDMKNTSNLASPMAHLDQKLTTIDHLGMDPIQNPFGFPGWINNPNESIGFGSEDEQMMLPFADTHN